MSNENQEAQNEFEAAAAARNAEIADAVSEYDNSRRPLVAGARYAFMAIVVVAVLSLLVWGGRNGMPGVWGVVLGTVIGGTFLFITIGLAYITAGKPPSVTAAVVLGGWLIKIAVLVLILVLIRDMDFYYNIAFFITIVLVTLVSLAAEAWGIAQENLTYVNPT